MATTIQISQELVEELKIRKLYEKESYEELLWDLLEDTQEVSEDTKRELEAAREEIKLGKFVTHEQLKKGLKI